MFEHIRNPRKEETASDKPRSINPLETEEQSDAESKHLAGRLKLLEALRQAREEHDK